MDILTAVHNATSRLRDATEARDTTAAQSGASMRNSADPVTAVACKAGETGEAAALALVHLGATDDVPAYLSTANAFALAREELEHPNEVAVRVGPSLTTSSSARDSDVGSAVIGVNNETLTWDTGSTNALALETALADLAAALVTTLAAASMRLAQPAPVVALSRASLAAADAYRSIHRDPNHASDLR
jgi:hypothetical protein